MKTFWKAALASVAAAALAFVSWRVVQAKGAAEASSPDPSTDGDVAAEGRGAGDELTREQRETLIAELEDQLGA
jgi:hypothetical protein